MSSVFPYRPHSILFSHLFYTHQYVDDFSKLARYAPDDIAIDATKQEKFLDGLNDELSMQLMVATFNNYQELVDRALMIEGKQQQIDNRKRKYGQGKYNSGA